MGDTGGAFGLEEVQLEEVMKTAADLVNLPGDIVVVINRSPNQIMADRRVYYATRDNPRKMLKRGDLDRMEAGHIYGELRLKMGRNDPYDGVYIVTNAEATDGYGPLLYDVAMEDVGRNGLKADTNSVTPAASRVWRKYNEERNVRKIGLGPAGDPLPAAHYHKVMPDELAKEPKNNSHLAQAYVSRGNPTISELEALDKLVQINTTKKEEAAKPAGKYDLSRLDKLYEDVVISIGADTNTDKLLAFDVQSQLQQKIWNGEASVRPGVKAALLDIVDEFLEGLDIEAAVKDIIITGSIANYNWSKFSDIDIHILLDFKEVNENTKMVKRFFDSVRSNWNKMHDIYIKGHEVEIYLQDEKEPHVSTGVYSLMDDRWLVKPKKIKPEIDKPTATKKMKALAREIGKLSSVYDAGKHEHAFKMAENLKEKLKNMRKAGLEKTGIYSPENLAFKMLRRSGDVEQLFSIYTQAYDKIYSLDQ